jgi:hypothetical protein
MCENRVFTFFSDYSEFGVRSVLLLSGDDLLTRNSYSSVLRIPLHVLVLRWYIGATQISLNRVKTELTGEIQLYCRPCMPCLCRISGKIV